MFSGPLGELVGRAGECIEAVPERLEDLEKLDHAMAGMGWETSVSAAQVCVIASAGRAADVNRAAARAGITLSALRPREASLEEVFLRMTGETPGGGGPMIRVVRSELVRLKTPAFLLGGAGLMTLLGLLATAVLFFTTGGGGSGPPGAQGISTAMLEASDGMFAGLQNFVSMVGIVALVIWAMSVTTDYSSGLIRLLVQAEPSRLRLLGGKVVALTLFTCASTLVVTLVVLAVAPPLAAATDVSTSTWDIGLTGTVLAGYVQFTLSVLLWGVVGLLVGILTRSTGIAVGIGIGYLLVFEMVAGMLLESSAKWLPGSVFTAIATGGSSDMSFTAAAALGAAYAGVAVVVSAVTYHRRDITA